MVVRPSRRATPIHPYSDLCSTACGTMSTSVVNPFAFTEISRIRGMVRSRPAVDAAALARVRRDLFGPVDHSETRKFVMRELAAQQALSSERWGFDFDREQPIRDGPGSSKYLWVKVTEEDNVPQAYSHEYTLTETIIRDAEDADVSAAAPTPPASPLEAASSTCPTASSPEEIHRSSKPAAKTVRRSSLRRSMKRRRPDESHQKKMTDFLRIRKSSSSLSVKAPKIRRLSDPAMSLPAAQRTGTS